MAIFRTCSGLVIRCFKRVEHAADWLTGKAGPVFVFLCWTLIILGGLCFFDAVGRDLGPWSTLLLLPIFILVPLNLYGQYYLVTHVPPGFPSSRALALSPNPLPQDIERRWFDLSTEKSLWSPERWGMRKRGRPLTSGYGHVSQQDGNEGQDGSKRIRRCRKCDGPKPERAHHCSVCKRCILLMDHHCPWINACVGLHNQRHFILFMVWLSIGCWTVALLGIDKFWDSFGSIDSWPGYLPSIFFTLTWVLCIAIGFAVPILCAWHIYMITRNETSIESHDNAYLESRAKADGLIYLNPYDLGRRRNLNFFFNIGPDGYSKWTLLFPLVVPPASNGWSYPRRSMPSDHHIPATGLHAPELADGLLAPDGVNGKQPSGGDVAEDGRIGRYVMGDHGSLTDDEEGGGGFMD
ncbi:DHHC palmitoyltransferase-domain-containing protein [Papiliotrema laurentii]|uniref:Palmitoyltransferase n=1 Tax=Papiliotrema laurentii TaxID=5418 RepID=A0AAD9FX31_PAPLA|nr:DHHC palmitoyltransferase-domain-containing protein [Papiliotrema laurentii]